MGLLMMIMAVLMHLAVMNPKHQALPWTVDSATDTNCFQTVSLQWLLPLLPGQF